MSLYVGGETPACVRTPLKLISFRPLNSLKYLNNDVTVTLRLHTVFGEDFLYYINNDITYVVVL